MPCRPYQLLAVLDAPLSSILRFPLKASLKYVPVTNKRREKKPLKKADKNGGHRKQCRKMEEP
eukprot:scaffold191108_cov18-Tisochrysis_lutea.AAC.1